LRNAIFIFTLMDPVGSILGRRHRFRVRTWAREASGLYNTSPKGAGLEGQLVETERKTAQTKKLMRHDCWGDYGSDDSGPKKSEYFSLLLSTATRACVLVLLV
jgi:hypothetical protein